MADRMTGAARAFLGQGLGMGWGDEGEAWLRSKLGDQPYEQALKKIRQEYAQYSQQNPVTSTALEFGGGMAPAVGMMLMPGAQAAGAAQATRTTGGALTRLAGLGAATGAVSGAGAATEGDRTSGAVTGGTIGAVLGAGIPVTLRSAKGAGQWLRDRLAPSEAFIAERAGAKLTGAMKESNLTPQQIEQMMTRDRAMGVPSTVANVDDAIADLAQSVAQRTGKGTRKVEKTLKQQQTGARDRTYQQVQKGLQSGNFYEDEARLVKELREKAGGVYKEAYDWGDVDDPRIVEALKNPQFQQFFAKARSIADTEASAAKLRGEDPSRFALPEIYKPTGQFTESGAEILELTKLPDVRTLDYIKRGIDASIDSGFRGQGMSTAEASALRDLRKEFVKAIDENVPAYRAARKEYAGDMEVIDAMRAGMQDFKKLAPEQLQKMLSEMSDSEKTAFRTGVARNLYDQITRSYQKRNVANEIVNDVKAIAKLEQLFDDPAHFRLFNAALTREAQMFEQAGKILAGSQTQKRKFMNEALEEGDDIGQVIGQTVTGNPMSALTGLVARLANKATITPQVADKLADMLMAKNPSEVAAVVKFLEQYEKGLAPKAVQSTATERGAVMGTTAAFPPAPMVEQAPEPVPDIDADIRGDSRPRISEIEMDLENESR